MLQRKRSAGTGCEARAIRACKGIPEDGHEVVTRARGGSITAEDNILMVCRPCHVWITDNPEEATCGGFVIPAWVGVAGLEHARAIREMRHFGRNVCPWWCKKPEHESL